MISFMWIAYLPLIILLLFSVAHAEIHQNGTLTTVRVRYNINNKTFSATADASFGLLAATVIVNQTFSTTGWDVLQVQADETFLQLHGLHNNTQRQLGYRAMGFGEGYATQREIEANLNNTFFGENGINALLQEAPEVVDWIDAHLAYMNNHINNNNNESDAYAEELQQLLALMDGMVLGYNARVKNNNNNNPANLLNRTWLFYLNFQAEIGDVATAKLPPTVLEKLRKKMPRFLTDLHCSALVKVLPNDIYFSHVTWNSFNSMLRQYKTYRVGNNRFITMSSYPGLIHSLDDWYMTHRRLAVMETTNGIHNTTLIQQYVKPESVSEFLRVMIANLLAKNSPDWVQLFSHYNSGTYSNQWMIFNMGIVRNHTTSGLLLLPSDTFWVAEQLPGNTTPLGITAADMTMHLNKAGYWASYNIPYFANVYNLSGTRELQETYGDFFSYTNYTRAKIFARNQSQVVDLASMKRLMRFNNYKEDPLSLIPNCTGAGEDNNSNTCNPAFSSMLTIASRGDLNPNGNATHYGPLFRYVGHRDHGATDVKIASWSGMMKQKEDVFIAHLICGPTNDQQPTFEWKDDLFDPMPPLYGLPKVYNFSFMTYTTYAPKPKKDEPSSDDIRNKWIGISIAAVAAVLVLIAIGIVLYRANKEKKRLTEADALLID